MARVNHKLVKQRLNEKRSKITDRQFFTSRLLAGHFEDMAAAQTRRYQYNRRVHVNLIWEPKDPVPAKTNNQDIVINCGHPLVSKRKGRENRYQAYLLTSLDTFFILISLQLKAMSITLLQENGFQTLRFLQQIPI